MRILKLLVLLGAIVAAFALTKRGARRPTITRAASRDAAGSVIAIAPPALAQTATIAGHVIDAANAPIAGASVCALTPTPTCTISGTNGTFTLANIDGADMRAIAEHRNRHVDHAHRHCERRADRPRRHRGHATAGTLTVTTTT
ncbi:MAG TPA: carboxypeptidase-like regulatory domain-containing protein [Kofleriaceae bacterium]|jgi:hypothetical protein